MNRHPASFTQAKEPAKVRSTTQRRDKTVNPLAPSGLGTISINSDTPRSANALICLTRFNVEVGGRRIETSGYACG